MSLQVPRRVKSSRLRLGDAWHHIVLTYDGGTESRLYLDGVDLGTDDFAFNTDAAAKLQIGSRGATDELAIFDRVLTPAEVTAQWTTGGPP